MTEITECNESFFLFLIFILNINMASYKNKKMQILVNIAMRLCCTFQLLWNVQFFFLWTS